MDLDRYVDRSLGRVRRIPCPHGHHHDVPAPLPCVLDLSHDTVHPSDDDRVVSTDDTREVARLIAGAELVVLGTS
jgi:hypothetical protein